MGMMVWILVGGGIYMLGVITGVVLTCCIQITRVRRRLTR